MAPEGPAGVKMLSVVRRDGYSSPPVNVTYVLDVNTVSPSQGSYAGGLLLAIHGNGFGVDRSIVDVKIGPYDCEVVEVVNTTIQCRQPSSSKWVKIDNNGKDLSKL